MLPHRRRTVGQQGQANNANGDSMPAKVKLNGLDLRLTTFTKGVDREMRRDGRRAAKIIQREAKELVPVRTGRLRRSIKVRAGKRRKFMPRVVVRVDSPYGRKIENQTHFAARASDRKETEVINTLLEALDRELRNL